MSTNLTAPSIIELIAKSSSPKNVILKSRLDIEYVIRLVLNQNILKIIVQEYTFFFVFSRYDTTLISVQQFFHGIVRMH